MMPKKTYFASDFHLGVDARLTTAERERQIVRWLHQCATDAEAIYLIGDVFDFWFEYRSVVPKGYTRLLGTLAELTDGGLPIYFFTGNHDMWIFKYFEQELGIPTYRAPIQRQIGGKNFFIGHGDGLGPLDYGYKRLKKVFNSPICQWLFERIHPNFGVGLANYWSQRSRATDPADPIWLGDENEWLYLYAQRKIAQLPDIDYFVFGHRHLPADYLLPSRAARYINTGDWMHYNSYAVFDGQDDIRVRFFDNPTGKVATNALDVGLRTLD